MSQTGSPFSRLWVEGTCRRCGYPITYASRRRYSRRGVMYCVPCYGLRSVEA